MMVEQRAEERGERLDPRQRTERIDYFIIYFFFVPFKGVYIFLNGTNCTQINL